MIEKGMEEDFLPEFYAERIPDEVFERMRGTSWREGCPVSREELRYLKVSHIGFDGRPRTGGNGSRGTDRGRPAGNLSETVSGRISD